MKKLFLFLLGFLLFFLAALFSLALLCLEKEVVLKAGEVVFPVKKLSSEKLAQLPSSKIQVQEEPLSFPFRENREVKNSQLTLSLSNFLGIPLGKISFPFTWQIQNQQIRLFQVSQQGSFIQLPPFLWEVRLVIRPLSSLKQGERIYQFSIYLFRKKLPVAYYSEGVIRVNQEGKVRFEVVVKE